MTATIIFPRDVERKPIPYLSNGACFVCAARDRLLVTTTPGLICYPCVDVFVSRQVAELQVAMPWDADDYQIRLPL